MIGPITTDSWHPSARVPPNIGQVWYRKPICKPRIPRGATSHDRSLSVSRSDSALSLATLVPSRSTHVEHTVLLSGCGCSSHEYKHGTRECLAAAVSFNAIKAQALRSFSLVIPSSFWQYQLWIWTIYDSNSMYLVQNSLLMVRYYSSFRLVCTLAELYLQLITVLMVDISKAEEM